MENSFITRNANDDTNSLTATHAPSEDKFVFLYFLIVVGVVLFVRVFIASPWLVSGTSMLPNFQDYNYLIVDRLTYRLSAPERGDVVVFGLPQMPSRDLIKRIVGLPGDTITIMGNAVRIQDKTHPDGFILDEPYLDPSDLGGIDQQVTTLGPDEYYVLGDNRRVSSDSRIWGVLPRSNIIGKVALRLFPFNEIDIVPSQSRYTQDIH